MRKLLIFLTLLALFPCVGEGSVHIKHTYVNLDKRIYSVMSLYKVRPKEQRIIKQTLDYASQHSGISKRMLTAMIARESSFNRYAVSVKHAKGLLQIMPVHKLADPFDPQKNIIKGAMILAQYVQEEGSLDAGLVKFGGGKNYPGQVYDTLKKLKL